MHKCINLRSILGISAGFRNNLVIAGIGSLAVATLTPETALAAPAITLKGSFDRANGAFPYAALTSAGNGKFYGTTREGGVNNAGAIFEFDPSGSGSITLKGSFDGANGADPFAALTSAGNGKFYGTTADGGVNGIGAIFEFDPGADSAPAPGPLPLMGAGAAFGWSRRLRRRIQPVRPLFPIGR
jgi:uncharacterized repeat protein (TIGR03803 family)